MNDTLRLLETELESNNPDSMKAKLLISKLQEISKELESSLKRHRLR
jgi:hypothetical protein